MKRLFVTGTDTGVGKTTIACALAAAYRAEGRRVATLKPVETGCEPGPDGLVAADAEQLAQAAGEPTRPADALCPNRYALPVSPEAAAEAEGRAVDIAAIQAAVAARSAADILLVEGAGGLLVPLGPAMLQVDLVALLGAPLLVVARDMLGTVNHTLLTLEAARRRGLAVAGVVLHAAANAPGPDATSNREAIARHGSVAVLGTLPWAPDRYPDVLARLAREHLDLKGLWQAL